MITWNAALWAGLIGIGGACLGLLMLVVQSIRRGRASVGWVLAGLLFLGCSTLLTIGSQVEVISKLSLGGGDDEEETAGR
jgi:hypothetical protein